MSDSHTDGQYMGAPSGEKERSCDPGTPIAHCITDPETHANRSFPASAVQPSTASPRIPSKPISTE